MRMLACCLTVAVVATWACAEDADPLQKSLNDMEVQGDWIYNDIDKGFAESKKTGKPLLVVFRCVP
jgi:serine protease Do